jgi:hypothetical protein
MVEGHVIEGAARCCAVSRAQSRAAATTNLARSNQSWVLRVLFGGAKSSALVNIFMIAPPDGRLVTADDKQILHPDRGRLMASAQPERDIERR